jgi:hypothetical protein
MWTKLEVYNVNIFLGSFYTNEPRHKWESEINEEYGSGNWTRFKIEQMNNLPKICQTDAVFIN